LCSKLFIVIGKVRVEEPSSGSSGHSGDTRAEKSTRHPYAGLLGDLEHLKIKTRLTNEMSESVMGEHMFLK
jgi:hypothetical protein